MRKSPDLMSDTQTNASPAKTWKNLGIRAVSAILLAAICVAPFYFGGVFWLALVVVFAGRMMWEWVRMVDPGATALAYAIPIIALILTLTYVHLGNTSAAVVCLMLMSVLAWFERQSRGGGLWSALGALYIAIPSMFIVWLRGNEVGFATSGFQSLIFLILIVIAADVGAYFGGSYFQGPKLFPRLSPKKTWSGFFSGLLCGMLMGGIAAMFMGVSFFMGLLIAIPVVLVSVLGDMIESAVKRSREVKDAGGIMPGHGGLLDRLDSLMSVMVVMGCFIFFFPQHWPF